VFFLLVSIIHMIDIKGCSTKRYTQVFMTSNIQLENQFLLSMDIQLEFKIFM